MKRDAAGKKLKVESVDEEDGGTQSTLDVQRLHSELRPDEAARCRPWTSEYSEKQQRADEESRVSFHAGENRNVCDYFGRCASWKHKAALCLRPMFMFLTASVFLRTDAALYAEGRGRPADVS